VQRMIVGCGCEAAVDGQESTAAAATERSRFIAGNGAWGIRRRSSLLAARVLLLRIASYEWSKVSVRTYMRHKSKREMEGK
jgi:hypothetical protein